MLGNAEYEKQILWSTGQTQSRAPERRSHDNPPKLKPLGPPSIVAIMAVLTEPDNAAKHFKPSQFVLTELTRVVWLKEGEGLSEDQGVLDGQGADQELVGTRWSALTASPGPS